MTKLEQLTSLMRDATPEEYESVNEYIRSISVDTWVEFYQTEESEKPVAKTVKTIGFSRTDVFKGKGYISYLFCYSHELYCFGK